MATYKKFEDLPIWQEARKLAKKVKLLTEKEKFSKDYKFTAQITDSSGSAMDNITEGFERGSQFEFVNHLSYSKGSAGETRSQLYRAFDYQYVTKEEADILIAEYEGLSSQIANFITYLNKSKIKGKKFEGRDN
jgi:four helix bundle protein